MGKKASKRSEARMDDGPQTLLNFVDQLHCKLTWQLSSKNTRTFGELFIIFIEMSDEDGSCLPGVERM